MLVVELDLIKRKRDFLSSTRGRSLSRMSSAENLLSNPGKDDMTIMKKIHNGTLSFSL